MKYNNKKIQSDDSKMCGQYCIYYLMCRCRGMEMNDIVQPFTINYTNNDQYICDYVAYTFPDCMKPSHENQEVDGNIY